ncbi:MULTISPECIES: HupE/UreJ family protein [Pirellulaceae]|nr:MULTISPECIES: HupE/UreJ family protein [Pirellulaceae]
MHPRLALFLFILPLLLRPAFAHQIDEYLQATIVTVESNRIGLQIRLTPGVEVAPKLLGDIDVDHDGTISSQEQHAYAEQVRRDLSLMVDGSPKALRLLEVSFPDAQELTSGMHDIGLTFFANFSAGSGTRRMNLENRHRTEMAVYLVNCLKPSDSSIHIIAQKRNYSQSSYQLDFDSDSVNQTQPVTSSGLTQWLSRTGGLSVGVTYFAHGIHHILTGYDHLLFVSLLALAATTLWDLVKVVTAFTFAHSITLTLATLKLVSLPGWIVEPVIAASIVFVALQNVFWPESARGIGRLVAAFSFGLFHGLGFAGGLLDLMHTMPSGTIVFAILGFSLGVEAGHLTVLVPLYGLLLAIRFRRDALQREQLAIKMQRLGSAGVLLIGVYYLCDSLTSSS